MHIFDEQSSSQASIDQKLKEAEVRKKSIETERFLIHFWSWRYQIFEFLNFFPRIKNLSSQLAKIDIAQHKKEESEKAKVWILLFKEWTLTLFLFLTLIFV